MNYYEELNDQVTKSSLLINDIHRIVNQLIVDELSLMDVSYFEENLDTACEDLKELVQKIVSIRLYIAFEEAGDELEVS